MGKGADPVLRRRFRVTGRVQGVGFRPTVYRHAVEAGLAGWVRNDALGVEIEVQGDLGSLDRFSAAIRNDPPPAAKISSITSLEIAAVSGESEFAILSSPAGGDKTTEISPDLATCPDCLSELRDPRDRRHRYPFINCTNCGPRYTIIADRPYDRPLTSMAGFAMCPSCTAEYSDPSDRRFHAQPDACAVCGPEIQLLGADGPVLAQGEEALSHTVAALREGKIVLVKGLGGFHLAVDPHNRTAVGRLRALKNRPNQSLALMVRDRTVASDLVQTREESLVALESARAPIVLLPKRDSTYDHLSPDNNYLGVMFPYTPLHHLLMEEFEALVMTSGNHRDEPLCSTDHEAQALIARGLGDLILTHNRPILHKADDSIVQIDWAGRTRVVRRSRGYVPEPYDLSPARVEQDLLAYGGDLKNTFALARESQVWLSAHVGDLADERNFRHQSELLADFQRLLEFTDPRPVGDAHPGYARSVEPRAQVYHHHAHGLSVMAEHGRLGTRLVTLSADGVGLGPDGTLWGFEFLEIGPDPSQSRHLAGLDPFLLPGGDRAVKDIGRIGASLCFHAHVDPPSYLPSADSPVGKIWASGLGCVATSSLGRLFDGVAALLGICTEAEYEGRGAIRLQKLAEDWGRDEPGLLPVNLVGAEPIRIDHSGLTRTIVEAVIHGEPVEKWARAFHHWVVEVTLAVSAHLGVSEIGASGGCFQNLLLIELLDKATVTGGPGVLWNQQVPCNDGGLALGQIAAFVVPN